MLWFDSLHERTYTHSGIHRFPKSKEAFIARFSCNQESNLLKLKVAEQTMLLACS